MNVAASSQVSIQSPSPSPRPLPESPDAQIVADVGGTFARLAWSHGGAHAPRIDGFRRYRCAQYPSLAAILADFAATAPPRPAAAVVAIAGLLQGDTLVNANLPWPVSVDATRQQAGLRSLQLINDFEAVALAIPHVRRDALVALHGDADPATAWPALVLGPGTGLGAALRFADGARPVLASEVGHSALSAGTALELDVLRLLLQRWDHVDNERVLSGTGLLNLYQCLCQLRGASAYCDDTEALLAAAHRGNDPLARETVDVFCGWLGSFVGDLAITFGARAVYLAGGVSAHIAPFLPDSPFVARFLNKGVLGSVLQQVPVWRVEHGELGVLGAAAWNASNALAA
ncbi:glucokinase [Stenotrophomonas sp. SORGH_AS321]|nr:glucokinase [Stenotrophomonas sp. SORGH_AS_0321]